MQIESTKLWTPRPRRVRPVSNEEVARFGGFVSNGPASAVMGGKKKFSPLSIAGCELWLRADQGTDTTTNGAEVSTWNDISGNGRHATQSTAGRKPTYVTNSANGKPGIRFDGANDVLAGSIAYPSPGGKTHSVTVFAVSIMTSTGTHAIWDDTNSGATTNTGHLWGQNGSNRVGRWAGSSDVVSYACSTTTVLMNIAEFDRPDDNGTSNGTLTIYEGTTQKGQNTVSLTGPGTSPSAIDRYRVGELYQDAWPWLGDILEVAVWGIALTSGDRSALSTYANGLYGTPL